MERWTSEIKSKNSKTGENIEVSVKNKEKKVKICRAWWKQWNNEAKTSKLYGKEGMG